jgi:hypothetical protein
VTISALLLLAPPARALPSQVSIGGDGSCPAPSAVVADLESLYGPPDDRAPSLHLVVRDLGDRFRVEGAGPPRELADAARDCAERARAAAAIALLILRPPVVALPQPAHTESRSPAPALRVELEGAGVVAGAPRADGTRAVFAGGGALRLSLLWRTVGLSLGAEALSPATLQIAMVGIRAWRAPFDLSLRGRLPLGKRLDATADLGLFLGVLHARGADLPTLASGTRLEPGLRAAVALRAWVVPRLALVFGFESEIAFQTTPLAVAPVGVVATTPRVWLAGTLGLAVRLH